MEWGHDKTTLDLLVFIFCGRLLGVENGLAGVFDAASCCCCNVKPEDGMLQTKMVEARAQSMHSIGEASNALENCKSLDCSKSARNGLMIASLVVLL